MATMTPDKYGYRKYLNEKGYKDEDITYDSGNIYVRGKYFDSATPEEDGSTYNSRANLDRTFGNFTRQNNIEQRQNASNDLLQAYQNRLMNQQPKTFDYNYKSDPLYKNALQAAQRGAETATNNAMVSLGRRGIGNSSSAVTAANQIQQRAIENVNSNVLPQLMDQAYRRFIDQQNMERQQAGDMLNLAEVYNRFIDSDISRQSQADSDLLKRRESNIKAALDVGKQYGVGVLPKESGEELFKQVQGLPTIEAQQEQRQYFSELVDASETAGRILPELASLIGVPPGTPTLEAQKAITDAAYRMGMLDVSRQNANTSSYNAETSRMNAETNARRADQPKEKNLNSVISSLNQKYLATDPRTNQKVITDPVALERAILEKDLTDEEYAELYAYYGLEIPQ